LWLRNWAKRRSVGRKGVDLGTGLMGISDIEEESAMSWDVVVVDIPPEIKRVADIPKGFIEPSIGKRAEVIGRIKAIIPTASFSDSGRGLIRGQDWSIEVVLGANEECSSFSLHLRGGDGALDALVAILQGLNLRGIDCQTTEFFVANNEGIESFERWKRYRDQIFRSYEN
jgi:hypothetical protein